MRRKVKFSVWLPFVICLVVGISSLGYAEEMKHMHGGGASMEMHHFHMLMNHGLAMVVQGSDMAMTAEMKMAPGVDAMGLQHGQHMIKAGKDLITRCLNGPEMMAMMKKHAKDPVMEYTHELGEAMVKVADMAEKMAMEQMSSPDMMEMHHMHMMINHAVQMAVDGADLIMLGRMGMAGEVDRMSVEHGEMMMKDAKAMVTDTMGSKEMMEMHAKGMTPEKSPMMGMSHHYAEAAMKVIDLLSKMPTGPK